MLKNTAHVFKERSFVPLYKVHFTEQGTSNLCCSSLEENLNSLAVRNKLKFHQKKKALLYISSQEKNKRTLSTYLITLNTQSYASLSIYSVGCSVIKFK